MRPHPEPAIPPREFIETLRGSGVDYLIRAPHDMNTERREQLTVGVLASAQDKLSAAHKAHPVARAEASAADAAARALPVPRPLLIGVAHDSEEDFRRAHTLLQERGHNALWILERHGNVYQRAPDAFIPLADKCDATLVTESQICGKQKHLESSLARWQRSAFVGSYLANQIAANPETPVAVVFGDNHIPEIAETTNAFLRQMGRPPVEFETSRTPMAAAGGAYSPERLEAERNRARFHEALLSARGIEEAKASLASADADIMAAYEAGRIASAAKAAAKATEAAAAPAPSLAIPAEERQIMKDAGSWAEVITDSWALGDLMHTSTHWIKHSLTRDLIPFFRAGGTAEEIDSLPVPDNKFSIAEKLDLFKTVMEGWVGEKTSGAAPNIATLYQSALDRMNVRHSEREADAATRAARGGGSASATDAATDAPDSASPTGHVP